ncbi:MAG: HlyD family efflux transporter periplasmic adaptor subunit [Acidobacteria bacterium]|nr:HlyD family efflux transporter periplasmic adaptor subunit [Acidobacteriota bacterium]
MSNTRTAPYKLFRAEALRAYELDWQGRRALDLGLPAAFTSITAAALAAAVVALITLCGYYRRVDMEGTVLPSTGVVDITAPSPGRVERLNVKEDQAVKKGAVLYTMDLDTATKDGGAQQRIIEAQTNERDMLTHEIERKARMSKETEQQLRQKIEQLALQINKLGDQITFQKDFVKNVAAEYNQFRSLNQSRIVSANEMDARQQAWIGAVVRYEDLENSKMRLEGELKDAQYQLSTNIQTSSDAIDELTTKISEIDEKLANSEAHRLIEIPAPEDGVVTDIIAHPGQIIGTGVPMLRILPQSAPIQAELLAPSSAIGFVHKGDRVLLRYSAFPYQKFGQYGGTVANVSQVAMNAEEVKTLLAGASPANEGGPFYRVIVKPDTQKVSIYGESAALPPGMRVQAEALLEWRRLYEWIFAPLYDLRRATRGL